MKININQIQPHPLTQGRIQLDDDILLEYSQLWEQGYQFPAIRVVRDPDDIYWLADGYHRWKSLFLATLPINRNDREIECDVTSGTFKEAIAIACGANSSHGLRRTNADKFRQVVIYFSSDPEWAKISSRTIATTCNVSHTLVNSVMKELQQTPIPDLSKRTGLAPAAIESAIANLAYALQQPIETMRNGVPLTIERKPEPKKVEAKFTGEHPSIPSGAPVQEIARSLTADIASVEYGGEQYVVDSAHVELIPDANPPKVPSPKPVGIQKIDDDRVYLYVGKRLHINKEQGDLKPNAEVNVKATTNRGTVFISLLGSDEKIEVKDDLVVERDPVCPFEVGDRVIDLESKTLARVMETHLQANSWKLTVLFDGHSTTAKEPAEFFDPVLPEWEERAKYFASICPAELEYYKIIVDRELQQRQLPPDGGKA